MPDDDLVKLAADLQRKARIKGDVYDVVKKGAQNVKTDWRRLYHLSEMHFHARRYPYSIGYDVNRSGANVEAEIGPDKGKTQGPLGNLIEFGSINNAPQNEGGRALLIEEPKFIAALEEVADLDL